MAAPASYGYTDIAAAQAGGANTLAALNDPNLDFARTKTLTAVYTMTGNEAANDAIYIARVPQGSYVEPVSGNVAAEAVATTCTLQVGDTDTNGGTQAYNPARYSAALNIAAGNTTVGFPFSGGTVLLTPAPIGDDWPWLLATFATLDTPVAGKKIVFRIRISSLD